MLWFPKMNVRCSGKNFFQRISTPGLDNPLMLWIFFPAHLHPCFGQPLREVIDLFKVQFKVNACGGQTGWKFVFKVICAPLLRPFLAYCLNHPYTPEGHSAPNVQLEVVDSIGQKPNASHHLLNEPWIVWWLWLLSSVLGLVHRLRSAEGWDELWVWQNSGKRRKIWVLSCYCKPASWLAVPCCCHALALRFFWPAWRSRLGPASWHGCVCVCVLPPLFLSLSPFPLSFVSKLAPQKMPPTFWR